MVKGVTRQVVMVRAPEGALFDQAIFLVRPDAVDEDGVTDEDILQQAKIAAGRYVAVRAKGEHFARRKRASLLFAALGAAAMGLVWLLTVLL